MNRAFPPAGRATVPAAGPSVYTTIVETTRFASMGAMCGSTGWLPEWVNGPAFHTDTQGRKFILAAPQVFLAHAAEMFTVLVRLVDGSVVVCVGAFDCVTETSEIARCGAMLQAARAQNRGKLVAVLERRGGEVKACHPLA